MATQPRQSRYSTIEYLLHLRDAMRPRLRFTSTSVETWRAWRMQASTTLKELLTIEHASGPLNPQIVTVEDHGQYLQEKVIFDADPESAVPCFVLVPKEAPRPLRAVLCLHGHGHGKDDVVGNDRGDPDRINRIYRERSDYARQFASRGFLALAPDARGFGERAEEGGCQKAMLFASLLGRDLTGMRISDHIRAIDYLQSRDDVDPDRIGCAGLSMGGWHTSILAAIDERVKVALIGGFFNTFADAFLDNHLHCSCHYPRGLYEYLDIPDIVALIAPRRLLITSGDRDYFPVWGARNAIEVVRGAYELLDASDGLQFEIFEGGHEFSPRQAFSWFDLWL